MAQHTPRSDNTVIKKHVLENYNHQPNQPTNFTWIVDGCFMHVDKSVHHQKIIKKKTTLNLNLPHTKSCRK